METDIQNLQPKDKIDSFLRMAEIQQTSLERRINIEWKIVIVFWTSLFVNTGFLWNKQLINETFWYIVLAYITFFILYFFWIGFLGSAHKTDKDFKRYYINQAEVILGITGKTLPYPEVRKKIYQDRWLIINLVITFFFMIISLSILAFAQK